jgi:serine/threonine protein kinase
LYASYYIEVTLIEKLHSEQILHNNLSPENVILGRTLQNPRLYLIDFKYSLKLLDNNHTQVFMDQGLEGELHQNIDEYSSVNKTLKLLQGKKDDLESIIYILISLHRGGRLSARTYEKDFGRKSLFDLAKWKATTSPEVICEGLPEFFALYLRHLKAHSGQNKPNYKFLRSLFMKSLSETNFSKNLANIIAIDIIKVVSAHKSKSESLANSCRKATITSEKVIEFDEELKDFEEDHHWMPPIQNSVKSLRGIFFKNPMSDIDPNDDENYLSETISDKMDSLTRFPSAK